MYLKSLGIVSRASGVTYKSLQKFGGQSFEHPSGQGLKSFKRKSLLRPQAVRPRLKLDSRPYGT